MFESSLALKDQVGIMVASETSYPITGFDYAAFFSEVAIAATLDFVGLAKNVCNNFRNASRQDPAFNYDYVSISGNDLTQFDKLASAVNGLAAWLIRNIDKTDSGGNRYFNKYFVARGRCGDFTQSACLIDLRQYLDELNHILNGADADFTSLYDGFVSAQTDCRKAFLPAIQPTPDPVTGEPGDPQFISVFFPDGKDGGSEKEVYDYFYASEGTAVRNIGATTWDNFIRNYHSRF